MIAIGFLSCLSCSTYLSTIDKSCEEFEDKTCDRISCCRFCDGLAADYSRCVEDRGVCGSEFFDCESGRSWWFWFLIIGSSLVGLALIALIIYLLKRNPNPPAPSPVGQAQPAVVLPVAPPEIPTEAVEKTPSN